VDIFFDIWEENMEYIKNIREKTPLIHFITNYVTVNDVANATLAIGASPIMTDEI
jgi:hydroxyethylthiazole kinase